MFYWRPFRVTHTPPDLSGMIHESHTMQLDNGTVYAAFPGQWFGTWRCKACGATRVRRTDSDWLDAKCNAKCCRGEEGR